MIVVLLNVDVAAGVLAFSTVAIEAEEATVFNVDTTEPAEGWKAKVSHTMIGVHLNIVCQNDENDGGVAAKYDNVLIY